MNTTAEDTRPLAIEITLTKADHLPAAEREELIHAFRGNLEIILGGRQAMHKAILAHCGQNDGPDDGKSMLDVDIHSPLHRPLMVADYTTWMGRDRPMGAHFGIRFNRVVLTLRRPASVQRRPVTPFGVSAAASI